MGLESERATPGTDTTARSTAKRKRVGVTKSLRRNTIELGYNIEDLEWQLWSQTIHPLIDSSAAQSMTIFSFARDFHMQISPALRPREMKITAGNWSATLLAEP